MSFFIQQAEEPTRIAFEGRWRTVLLQPSDHSPQQFVVGVVVSDLQSVKAYRLLKDFRKFECVYGQGIKPTLRVALKVLDRALQQKGGGRWPDIGAASDAFSWGGPEMYCSSPVSARAATNHLYSSVVAMEPPEREPLKFVSRDNEEVRQPIHEILKLQLGLRFSDWIFPDGMLVEDREKKTSTTLDIDICTARENGIIGAITSAWYANRASVEVHMLRAFQDIAIARQQYRPKKHGIIMIRPDEKMPASAARDIEKFVLLADRRCRSAGTEFIAPKGEAEAVDAVKELLELPAE